MNFTWNRAFAKVRGRNTVSAFALVAGMCLAAPAVAQDTAADVAESAPPAASEQGEIVVTGSRITRSGFTTPTPVTVVGEAQIARQGATNIAQILNEIPAFRPQSTPSTSAIFMSNLGASTADLRGLGGNRTLVLIDGRRVVASTVAGGSFTPANTVDLNLVPATLLSRVDVVTGGASAAYGSDAVAGVTDLIINSDLQGIRGSVSLGGAEQGDARTAFISLAYGTRFDGARGRFVIGGDFVDDNGTGDCYTRDWCAVSYNTVSNPFVAGSTTQRVLAGAPATLILQNARTSTASINGLVIAGPLRGTEFNSNGTTFAHNYGIYGGAGLFQSGGGDSVLPFYQFFSIATPSERLNVFFARRLRPHGEPQRLRRRRLRTRRRRPARRQPPRHLAGRRVSDPARQRVPAGLGAQRHGREHGAAVRPHLERYRAAARACGARHVSVRDRI